MSCETVTDIDLGSVNVGGTNRYRAELLKDGVAWIGVDSVAFIFEEPDRSTQFTRAGVLETPDAGVWYYDSVVTDITVAGDWTLSVQVTDGSTILRYPHEIGFRAASNP